MEVALGIVGSLAVATGIVALIIRSARRGLAIGIAPIATFNAIMLYVGNVLGLTFDQIGDDYGTLHGTLGDVHVEVRVRHAYYEWWIQLLARVPRELLDPVRERFPTAKVRYSDDQLVVEPAVRPIRAGRYLHWVPGDATELRKLIEDLTSFVADYDAGPRRAL